ncbi:MAG: amino acid permease [Planctomycetes bacterium]|nr:amino acid permease [Planctomycetota bacterium]
MSDANRKSTAIKNGGLAERNRFGTFGGVFTPSILTILGVILFMRANFVLGETGIMGAVIILLIAKSITFLTSLSIAAISTNMQVRGGGSYYLISRVLGPEFGGAIGIALFCALALSVPFYVLGFTEALCRSIPSLVPHFQLIAFATAGALFVIAYIGAGWAIRTQYFIMAFLFLAIIAFMGGAVFNFKVSRFLENWGAPDPESLKQLSLPLLGFWAAFALYFPAVTGIDAGVNMSGDLKEPSKSIPRGTISAVCVGFLVYLVQLLLAGGSYERVDLIQKPFQLLKENALFNTWYLVVAGVFAATLSSALGSFLGAPRVLQAVSRDPVLLFLRPFAKGTIGKDEPRRALISVAIITAIILFLAGNEAGGGALNLVAVIVTMFFLYTYGIINLAAFVEALGGNPSFRPVFRFFHWGTALLGAVGCVVVTFLINPVAALVAICLIAILYWYVTTRHLEASFGDARRGLVYASARKSLLQLASMEEDPRNWRPNILSFCGNPASREMLVNFSVWMESGRGFVLLVNILTGSYENVKKYRESAFKQLKEFCRENNIQAFPMVVAADSLEEGVSIILQTASIGPIRPNLVAFGWPKVIEHTHALGRQMRMAEEIGMSLAVVIGRDMPKPREGKRIDLWWRGQKNGSIMFILSHLITCNWEWGKTTIRVLRVVENEAGRAPARVALEELVAGSRVRAQVQVVVSERPFSEVLRDHSQDAACVVLGFIPPREGEEEAWYNNCEALLNGMPATLLVSSTGGEDMMA